MRSGIPYEQLPIILNQEDVENILGLSRSSVQMLFHAEDFPALEIMKRNLVSKESFMDWLDYKEKEENGKKAGAK